MAPWYKCRNYNYIAWNGIKHMYTFSLHGCRRIPCIIIAYGTTYAPPMLAPIPHLILHDMLKQLIRMENFPPKKLQDTCK